MTTFVPAQCYACTRLHRDNSTMAGLQMVVSCDAYPGQVPDDIRTFGDDHRTARGDEFGGLVFDPDPEREEAFGEWARFAGVTETVPLTAAAPPSSGAPCSGAMIALVPTVDDLEGLALPGGEPADQLHCTMLFLGEADMWSPAERAGIVDVCRKIAAVSDVVEAEAFAVSMFNPHSDEPCVVFNLSGSELADLYDAVAAEVEPGVDQHQPWTPHLTVGYYTQVVDGHFLFGEGGANSSAALADLLGRCGPVVFDRLRVAFGDEVTDIPLGEPPQPDAADVVTAAVRIPWSGCPRCFAAVHEGPCSPEGLRSPSTGRG
jgi:2'-5' RNA ligase superfamily protein